MQQISHLVTNAKSRDEFLSACPWPFLVGASLPKRSRERGKALGFEAFSTVERDRVLLSDSPAGERPLLVIPVRKVHHTYPSMITVGRTRNNDVVLDAAMISKFHAFFRVGDGQFALADAGSQNRTRVGELLLERKGAPHVVHSGDRIFFAELEFQFLDAGACWDRLQTGA